jgi:superfamily II DNA or RNA helicase
MIESVHGKKNMSEEFIYTTPQSLVKNLDKIQEPDLLIIDECNVFYNGKLFDKIFAHWKTCRVAGFTATPYYYKRKTVYKNGWMCSQTTIVSIEDQYGPAVINVDREAGHAMGYSPDIKMQKVGIAPLTTEHLSNPVVYGKIIDDHLHGVSDLCKTLHNGIIYCDSIAHAELLSKTFNIPTIFGDTPKKRRVDLIERFNQGRIPFLLTVGCLVRGYDRQDLENIILLTNFNNSCELEQVVGRLNRGTCKKVCYYNRRINTRKPVVGDTEIVKIKRI